MDFADDSFDTVMAAYVVTAVPDYRKVVNEMIRVCKPGGRIIMLNHFSNGNKLIAAVEKVILPSASISASNRPLVEHRARRDQPPRRP